MEFEPSRDFVEGVMRRVRSAEALPDTDTPPTLRERAGLALAGAGGLLGVLSVGRFCLGFVSPALCG